MSTRSPKTRKQVIGHLLLLGWDSLDAWSKAHGYQRTNTHNAVDRWIGRTDKAPRGVITISIMNDLNRTLEQRITPEGIQA